MTSEVMLMIKPSRASRLCAGVWFFCCISWSPWFDAEMLEFPHRLRTQERRARVSLWHTIVTIQLSHYVMPQNAVNCMYLNYKCCTPLLTNLRWKCEMTSEDDKLSTGHHSDLGDHMYKACSVCTCDVLFNQSSFLQTLFL